ncbi:MAG: aminotransferase class III-fold pyridoxal phosphate-dependent enzyme, partial [Gemmatimonadota bacterium]|nr:aminotransferase class III-fold pyridoxal phosphate-dependent enzyme [Gemmatimonadota bacterium]
DEHRLVERCHQMGPVFHRKLEALLDLPFVGDIRGRGLLAGIEFVQDKDSRTAFPRAARFAERFTQAAQDAGLIVWPNTGQANGTDGDLAMLAPPFVVSDEEIDQIVDRFATALERTPARP